MSLLIAFFLLKAVVGFVMVQKLLVSLGMIMIPDITSFPVTVIIRFGLSWYTLALFVKATKQTAFISFTDMISTTDFMMYIIITEYSV
jgi:hypothetical protein